MSFPYLEIPSSNLVLSKQFFRAVFGWEFTDYGDSYSAFVDKETGLDGGFYQSEQPINLSGGVLVVFYNTHLVQIQNKITQANAVISRPIFTFPGGKRFHFIVPATLEFAVWSKK